VQQVTISAKMADGSVVQTFDSVRSYSDDNEIKVKYISPLPLNVSAVDTISVNGAVIKFDA